MRVSGRRYNLPRATLPRAGKSATVSLTGYRGLDRRTGAAAGRLTVARGVDPRRLPELVTLKTPGKSAYSIGGTPHSLHPVGDDLFAVSRVGNALRLTRIHAGVQSSIQWATTDLNEPRVVLPFQYYSNPDAPFNSATRRPMAAIYPENRKMFTDVSGMEFSDIRRYMDKKIPTLRLGHVYLSRVFGADGDLLYASNFNDAGGWDFDEAGDISAAHAWATTSQSGARSAGDFTAITSFGGQLLAFKENACFAVYNNRNPFRLSELMTVGAASGKSVAQTGGYLFFTSARQVYCYDGSTPREIGAPLGDIDFSGAIGAGFEGLYYLYVPNARELFVYSPATGAWAAMPRFWTGKIAAMTATADACLFADTEGTLYTTENAAYGRMEADATPLLPAASAPFRLFRLRLAIYAAPNATVRISYVDTNGRESSLCDHTAKGGAEWLNSRVLSPADYGGTLRFAAEGEVRLGQITLVMQTGE